MTSGIFLNFMSKILFERVSPPRGFLVGVMSHRYYHTTAAMLLKKNAY